MRGRTERGVLTLRGSSWGRLLIATKEKRDSVSTEPRLGYLIIYSRRSLRRILLRFPFARRLAPMTASSYGSPLGLILWPLNLAS